MITIAIIVNHLIVAYILNLAGESHITSNPGGQKAHDSHDYDDDYGVLVSHCLCPLFQ